MKYTEILVAFMRAKKNQIINATEQPELGEYYFIEDDAEELLALPEKTAKKIYIRIEEAIASDYCGLHEKLCPFCYIAAYCGACNYAERHKVCQEEDSDYDKLFQEFEEIDCDVSTILSEEFYKDLIEKLEKEGL